MKRIALLLCLACPASGAEPGASGGLMSEIEKAMQPAVLFELDGHESWVKTAVYSPDGSKIVTASEDGTAAIWDAATREKLQTLTMGSWVKSAVFSPDASRVAAIADDHGGSRIFLWDAATGRKLKSPALEGVNAAQSMCSICVLDAHFVQFSPDGATLLAGFNKGAALFDVRSGKRRRAFLEGVSVVAGAFHPTNGTVYLSSGTSVVTYSTEGGEPISTARHANLAVTALGVSPDGLRVGVGSEQGAWVMSLEPSLLLAYPGSVSSIEFSRDGSKILTAGAGDLAIIWDAASGAELRRLKQVGGACARLSPDGCHVSTGGFLKASVWKVGLTHTEVRAAEESLSTPASSAGEDGAMAENRFKLNWEGGAEEGSK